MNILNLNDFKRINENLSDLYCISLVIYKFLNYILNQLTKYNPCIYVLLY